MRRQMDGRDDGGELRQELFIDTHADAEVTRAALSARIHQPAGRRQNRRYIRNKGERHCRGPRLIALTWII